ncbi:MAG: phosphotransferase family protein [Deltaproteobacteria bacterium]|nr:phosphotransferase family protein [Deltaproteobacteria bacterium]
MAEESGGGTTDASSEEIQTLRAPFEAWLASRWPEAKALEVLPLESPKSGFSAKTLFAPVRFRRDGNPVEARVVLRIENPEPAIYPVQAPGLDVEIAIQYRVMQGLDAAGGIPLAPLIGYETDPGVLGSPFFAMGHVAGDVATENPPYTQAGFFTESSPETRRAIIEDGLRVLADVHRVDWRAAGFTWLVPPGVTPGLETQLDLWESYGRRELRDRTHPVFEAGVHWLRANLPTGLENCFSWGDSRLGNMIFSGERCVCIMDFENASIAPAEVDLGWWLMFDRTQHEVVSAERLPGEPTRDEQREYYARCAGRDFGDTHYYEVFAAFRYAAIVVRVMNRWVDRGLLPPDQKLWLANPASQCLADLLGIEAPW